MKCQNCGSENVTVQLINKQELMNLKEKKRVLMVGCHRLVVDTY